MTASFHNNGRFLATSACRAGSNAWQASRNAGRIILAGLCRLAVVLAVMGPPPGDVFQWKSVEAKSQQFGEEFVREREETFTVSRGFVVNRANLSSHVAARVRSGAFVANALAYTSDHVLANGLRAPLTC